MFDVIQLVIFFTVLFRNFLKNQIVVALALILEAIAANYTPYYLTIFICLLLVATIFIFEKLLLVVIVAFAIGLTPIYLFGGLFKLANP
nr:hypothetical protein [Nostoc sp. DedQUE03]